MSIATAVVLSLLLLTVTGCATAGAPPATKQEAGHNASPKNAIAHDEEKAMNEQSRHNVMDR